MVIFIGFCRHGEPVFKLWCMVAVIAKAEQGKPALLPDIDGKKALFRFLYGGQAFYGVVQGIA